MMALNSTLEVTDYIVDRSTMVNLNLNFLESVSIFCNNAGINHTAGWRKCLDVNIVSKQTNKINITNKEWATTKTILFAAGCEKTKTQRHKQK